MKTMTIAAICQHNDLSVGAAEKALANLQEKGLVTGFIKGNLHAKISLTDEGAQYFGKGRKPLCKEWLAHFATSFEQFIEGESGEDVGRQLWASQCDVWRAEREANPSRGYHDAEAEANAWNETLADQEEAANG